MAANYWIKLTARPVTALAGFCGGPNPGPGSARAAPGVDPTIQDQARPEPPSSARLEITALGAGDHEEAFT